MAKLEEVILGVQPLTLLPETAASTAKARYLNLALYDQTDLRQLACLAQGGHASVELEHSRLFDLMHCLHCGARYVVVRKDKLEH